MNQQYVIQRPDGQYWAEVGRDLWTYQIQYAKKHGLKQMLEYIDESRGEILVAYVEPEPKPEPEPKFKRS